MKRSALAFGVVCATVVAWAAIASGAPTTIEQPAYVSAQAVRVPPPTTVERGQLGAVQLFNALNAERQQRGLRPYQWQQQVANAALTHAVDMANLGTLGHRGSDGSNAGTRLTAAGFTWSSWGENLAAGFDDPIGLIDAWLASPAHRPQMIGTYTYAGVGLAFAADGTPYWTLVVASAP